VATIQAFRKEVTEVLIPTAVFGFPGFTTVNQFRYRESRASYSENVIGPRFDQNRKEGATGADLFAVWPEPQSATFPKSGIVVGLQNELQPGEKAYQFRCWALEQDEELDSNSPALVVGMEIEVHRCLMFQDEEYFYCNDEMLENQVKLLTKQTWRNLATLDTLVAGPVIDSVPTREENVISYTVEVSASVVPD
jgi:hypothetical protein